MRVVIAGCRDIDGWFAREAVERGVELFELEYGVVDEVLHGGARGVDMAGAEWASRHRVWTHQFLADWDRWGRSAGPRRNGQMANYGEGLIAVWDGESRGTGDMIRQMRRKGKPVVVVEVVR